MSEFSAFLPLSSYAGMALLVLCAAFMQGVGGLGFAMFAAPVAAILYPELVPGPMLLLGGSVALLSAWRERRAILWPAVGRAVAGRMAGSVVAIAIMSHLAPAPTALLFAAMILLAVGLSVAGVRILPNMPNLLGAGVASGLMGTLTSVGAPPLAIVLQHTSPASLRATLGAILCLGASLSLLMLAAVGQYGVRQLLLSLSLLPCMFLGFALSGPLRAYASQALIRRLLLAVCALSAVGLIVRTL